MSATAAPATPATATATPARTAKAPRGRGQRSPLASFGIHATLVVTALIAILPIIWVALTSFKPRGTWNNANPIQDPTLGNYRQVLFETELLTWFGNSLLVAAGTMVLGVFLSATAAYALSRFRFPGRRPMLWSFLLTQMFPVAILIVPLYNLMSTYGLLNNFGGLILAYCTTAVPFCTWMLKGYFDSVPVEIDEAGQVDGLTPLGTFYRLVLPLARPGLAVTAFYSFITAWGEVAYASVFMTGNESYTLPVGLSTFVDQYKTEWGLMTSASVLITIPAAIIFLIAQRGLVQGLTAGGTKG
ncbi:sugar ABC transporter permease [Allostreptomyces psammosilenae]|nr:carbohydrate ABC transporter permease [Allostreptomyces psammosilenae]